MGGVLFCAALGGVVGCAVSVAIELPPNPVFGAVIGAAVCLGGYLFGWLRRG